MTTQQQPKNVTEARQALESKVRITAGSHSQHTDVMAAADVLGDARELAGRLEEHLEVCPREREDGASCGGANGYLCKRAEQLGG